MRRALAFSLVFIAGAVSGTFTRAARPRPDKKLAEYNVIVVNAFTIDKSAATSSAPQGLESMIHARAVRELQAKAIFDGVIDATPAASGNSASPDGRVDLRISPIQPVANGAPSSEPRDAASSDRRVILSGTILSFTKGNRATRYFTDGFGAGESKLKMRFTLNDAKTGAELMSWTEQGTFKGALTPFGGSANQATAGATNGVVKGLLKQIEKNR